ncbi:hypothetical protein TURU_012448 [Turdus rufiventris]|nr:hypothetical protein TURU_012448 [Turdus rufiventris]
MILEQHGLQKSKISSENLFDSSHEAAAFPALVATKEDRTTIFPSPVENGLDNLCRFGSNGPSGVLQSREKDALGVKD